MTTRANPATSAVAVTKSDSTVHTPPFRALFIGGAGVVRVRTADGNDDIDFTVQAGTLLPVSVDMVKNATTATLIVGLR